MSRKRMLDPGIWTDDGFLTLAPEARLLFIGLISHADDEGRGNAELRALKAKVFPGDNLSDEQITALCETVAQYMRVVFYEVNGSRYYQLERWDDYQTVNHARPSVIPGPIPEGSGNGTGMLPTNELTNELTKGSKGIKQSAKRTYAPHVELTEEEHEALSKQYGSDVVTLAIELLDAYKLEKGKHYKSDAGALRSWGIQAALERRDKTRGKGGATPTRQVGMRFCPSCKREQRHTGSMCLECGADMKTKERKP